MIELAEVRPEWGHPLLTPSGDPCNPVREIRVPKFAFPQLRRLGLLEANHAQLLPVAWLLLGRSFFELSGGLAQLLGADLTGPAWLVCRCPECQHKEAESDHTALPGRNPLDQDAADRIVRQVRARRTRG